MIYTYVYAYKHSCAKLAEKKIHPLTSFDVCVLKDKILLKDLITSYYNRTVSLLKIRISYSRSIGWSSSVQWLIKSWSIYVSIKFFYIAHLPSRLKFQVEVNN